MILKKGVTIENKIKWDHKKWASWYDRSIFYSLYDHIFLHWRSRCASLHHTYNDRWTDTILWIFHRTISIMVLICSSYSFLFYVFNKNQWKEYYQLIITLGTGMTLFLIISLVFPNGQDLRPVLTGDSIFIKAVQMIYHTDNSDECTSKYPCI